MSEGSVNYTVKECSGCGGDIPIDRADCYCKSCRAEATRRWREKNPDANRRSWKRGNSARLGTGGHLRSHLMRCYGLTLEDYWGMVDMQDGVCEICLQEPEPGKRLHVDHDHTSGRIRGLLCGNCNRALGLLSEDSENARRAMVYLQAEDRVGV